MLFLPDAFEIWPVNGHTRTLVSCRTDQGEWAQLLDPFNRFGEKKLDVLSDWAREFLKDHSDSLPQGCVRIPLGINAPLVPSGRPLTSRESMITLSRVTGFRLDNRAPFRIT